jgi:hypothetical protein
MRLLALGFVLLTLNALAQPALIPPDAHKHLMLDSRVMLRTTNARLTPGSVVKEPRNPLFTNDKPWENALNNLYPNVLWDEQEQVFKLWYKCVLADKEVIAQMDQPSTVHDVGWYLLYSTSKDGIVWDKPKLGLHEFNGSAETNIVARDTPNVGVFKDLHEADSSRRYKMVFDVGLGKPRMRFSADGIHWGDTVEALGFGAQNGDTHNNAFWDERSGKYLWFTKLYLGERLVARLESYDFLHWKNTGLVLRSTMDEGRAHQTYCLPVFRYANVYLGYAMIYNVGTDRSVDCELAWSPDSITWQRIAPGTPLIPRGPKGSYDGACIYAMAGPPIVEDNNLMIFYGGDHFPHTGWKRSCLPCIARLPLDHFAGYEQEAKAKPATLFTRQFRVTGEPLRVTADAKGGAVRIVALDEVAASVDYTADISDNVIEQPVQWHDKGLSKLKGQIIHLQVELTGGAKLYAISGLEMIHTDLPVPLNPLKSPHRKPAPVASKTISFDHDAQGWKGVDKAEYDAAGFVRFSRSGRALPIAMSPITAKDSPLVGDWTQLFGGKGAQVQVRVRAPKPGGKVRLEIFANDVSQWYHETNTPFGTDWTTATATLRYDWSDAEATAAGWTRAVQGFPWSDTITHVGKVVITPGLVGAQESFDLDEVTVRGE